MHDTNHGQVSQRTMRTCTARAPARTPPTLRADRGGPGERKSDETEYRTPGTNHAKVLVSRPIFQGANVELLGAGHRDLRPPQSYTYDEATLRLWTDPNGMSYAPELLSSDQNWSEQESIEKTRLRPLSANDQQHIDRVLMEYYNSDAASEDDKRRGIAKLPLPNCVLDNKFTYKFDAEHKAARITSARKSEASKRPAAVARAHNEIATAEAIEKIMPRLQKQLTRLLYTLDCARYQQTTLHHQVRQLVKIVTGKGGD